MRKSLEALSLSPQSVKHCLALLKRILRYAAKAGAIEPVSAVFEMPRVDNRRTEAMSAAQLAAYWHALDEEPDQEAAALLRIALLTGMRKGALLGLAWADLDFENGQIRLDAAYAKNGRTGFIPMSKAACDILQGLPRRGEFVWPGRDGGKRSDFARIARRVRDRAGLPPDFRPMHGLRHSFASALASSGKVSLFELKELLTHGSLAMTQRYSHLADEGLRRAAGVADEAIAGARKGTEDE